MVGILLLSCPKRLPSEPAGSAAGEGAVFSRQKMKMVEMDPNRTLSDNCGCCVL